MGGLSLIWSGGWPGETGAAAVGGGEGGRYAILQGAVYTPEI